MGSWHRTGTTGVKMQLETLSKSSSRTSIGRLDPYFYMFISGYDMVYGDIHMC